MVTQVGLNKYLQQLLPLTSGKPLARALLLAFLCRSHMFWVYPWEQEGASLAARGATPPLRRTGLRAVPSLSCHVRQSSISTRLAHVVTLHRRRFGARLEHRRGEPRSPSLRRHFRAHRPRRRTAGPRRERRAARRVGLARVAAAGAAVADAGGDAAEG